MFISFKNNPAIRAMGHGVNEGKSAVSQNIENL